MAVTYGFYNSLSGDRTYDARQLSSLFDGVLTDGVFETIGNKLMVTDGSGMQVIVGTGKSWFNHTWTINDSGLALSIAASNIVNPRIDAVVLEVNESSGVRANSIKVITGTPAAVPVEPTLTNTSEIHQYPLPWVSVGAGISEINPGDITNLVGTIYCPFVTVPSSGPGNVAGVLQMQIFS